MRFPILVWVIILAVLAGYEFYTLLDHDPGTLPLTTVTVTWVPWWVTLPFITWLWIHFAVRYF